MNDPVYDLSATAEEAQGVKPAAEPMYEPPGFLPSSYQPVTGPVNLVPRFDTEPQATAASEARVESSALQQPPAQSMTEFLQSLPAPTQAPVSQSVRQPAMAGAPAASSALSDMPAPAVGSVVPSGAAGVPGSLASAPPPATRAEARAAQQAAASLPGPVPVAAPTAPVPPPAVSSAVPQATTMPAPVASPVPEPATTATTVAARRDPGLDPDPDLDAALQRVLMTSGSDLHVSAGAAPMIRVDGSLRPIEGAPVWDADKVASALLSILTPKQKAIFDEHLEFDFAYTLSENARFRVNLYQQRHSMGAAFRLIPTEIKPLSALGVPESIGSFARLARGLVLVTGPTGSGKSTTLAALIDLVNRTRSDHIMTVEDPIEFLHGNQRALVNQREVGHDTHSFAAALKHVLRQDPDVILVGELRDLETISVALTAAETGHLVFATLHTQDAPQTIDRIIDVYPPHQQNQVRAQLAATLQGVVCQTLVKRANGKGRVVATEVLMATHAVANLIREGKTYQVHSVMQAGREHGMHTMDQHLADLVNSGQISFEAAVEKAQDFEVLKRLVTRSDSTGALGATMSDGVNYSDAYSGQR